MIFLLQCGYHEPDQTPKLDPSATPSTRFLFNTNEHFTKSAIAVTHSRQKTVFLLSSAERMKRSASAVTHSKSTTTQVSIQYKWTVRNTASLSKKIANSAPRTPRA
jgi:hypothetical protein